MGHTSEIYLTKNNISKEEWQKLIETISNYNGILKKWKIIITNINNNTIRYFIETNCSLPPTINNNEAFILKESDKTILPKESYTLPYIAKLENILDIINKFEIKNQGKLLYTEITLKKIYQDKIFKTINLYVNKNSKIIKYKILLGHPNIILSANFNNNKRFLYKKTPKYLDTSKIFHLLNSNETSSLFKVDTFPYLQGDFYLNQNNYDFNKHSVIFGSSGTGKSKFISLLISNINNNPYLKEKYKVVVIDPHAALEKEIGGLAKVLDFKTNESSINLFSNNKNDTIANTELLLELFKSLIKDQYNSKLERVLRHSIHILLANNLFNFSNLRKLLLDLEYRNNLVKKRENIVASSVITFFLTDFNDLKTKSYNEAISPIISFIDEMEMLPVFNNQINTNTLEHTIQNNFLTLFSLDRTKIGDKITETIAGLVMQQLLTLIQSYTINKHIIFIVDEVALIENPILSRFLSEARKYNLSLILAGQYFNQISEKLKQSIFANVINYYIFRISKLDANLLAENFNMKIPLDESKNAKVKLLTELNNRECIARISNNDVLLPAFKGKTSNFKSIPRAKEKSNLKKQETKKQEVPKTITNFKLGNVNLNDILSKTSSSRKVVNNEY